ncbi:MAG TPA: putative Ig domain-containing protein [Acidimicrobiales bacterium]
MRARIVMALLVVAGMLAGAASGADPSRSETRVTVFGDSAATAMAYDPKARAILGSGVDLKLEVAACRRLGDLSCPYDGVRPPNVIERASELGRELGRVVVVAVGYNDYETTYADNIEETLRVLGKAGVERVLWTTLRAERQSWARMNEMIVTAAKKHPELAVLDWNARARIHPDWLQPDGIHLTPAGAQGMATMINEALVGLGIASRPRTERQLSIASRPLPAGHVGRRYATRLRAQGGTAPYLWARVGGRLAPGLRLTPAGLVTGTPTRVGRYRFVARVVDRAGTVRTRVFVASVA